MPLRASDEPTLVVVTGPPGSGKTTIATRLARRCSLPLLAKDPLKEILFDTFGWSDRAWSRRLGRATYPPLFEAVRAVLAAKQSVVVEAAFDHAAPARRFDDLPPARVVQVHCTADPDVLLTRIEARARSGDRHRAHGGVDAELARRIRARDYAPLALDAPCFELVTDRFEDVRFGDIDAAMPAPEDNGRRPALVVVSGPPATGKTSIAKKMAAELGIPFITKDTLKERLYETFGHGDGVEDAIDRAALAMLFSVVESNLAAGVSVMAESNFDARSDVQPFRDLCAAHDVRIVQVHMDRDTERLLEHFAERSASGDRHPGHEDDPEDAETVRRELEAGLWNALEIPGALIEADADEDRGAIVARVRAVLEQE